jgi:hypothetical protein
MPHEPCHFAPLFAGSFLRGMTWSALCARMRCLSLCYAGVSVRAYVCACVCVCVRVCMYGCMYVCVVRLGQPTWSGRAPRTSLRALDRALPTPPSASSPRPWCLQVCCLHTPRIVQYGKVGVRGRCDVVMSGMIQYPPVFHRPVSARQLRGHGVLHLHRRCVEGVPK